MRTCTKCEVTSDDFRPKQSLCRLCQNAYNNAWNRANRARGLKWRQNNHLKRSYGITLEDYWKISAEQKGLCAICGLEETTRNQHGVKKLAVDHSHATGKVRGLLCYRCNIGLGSFRDNPAALIKAAQYLKGNICTDLTIF
jgi:hypothetical protein